MTIDTPHTPNDQPHSPREVDSLVDAELRHPRIVTFLIPLPFDMAVPNDSTITRLEEGVFIGFEDVEVAPASGIAALPNRGLRPGLSLQFRSAEVPVEDPWRSLGLTFPELLPVSADAAPDALTMSRTSVSAVRILRGDPKANEEESIRWLSNAFDELLGYLNEFLVSLGSTSNQPAIGPVAITELPLMLPFKIHVAGQPLRRSDGWSGFRINDTLPGVSEEISRQRFYHAADVLEFHHSHGHPFRPYAEAMVAARRSFNLGQMRLAVIEAGTAIEILVSAVVREVSTRRGEEPAETDKRLGAPFRNRVVEHMVPMTGVPGRLDDPESALGSWWADTYLLRNRVVHEGYQPPAGEAHDALVSARRFMEEIGRSLQANDELRQLGELLVLIDTNEIDASGWFKRIANRVRKQS